MRKEQDNLKEAIGLLKRKQAVELTLLKEQIHEIHESIRPTNIIKNAFKQAVSAPDIKSNFIDNIIGLASGYVSKKAFVGGSHNTVTRILGTLLQIGVSNVTSKNSEAIRSLGEKVIQFIFKKTDKNKLNNSVAE